MRSTRASLVLTQVAFVAATGLSALVAYAYGPSVCVLEQSREGSPDADVQPFPWHLVCRDFTRISNICEAFHEQ